jgi:hypothetical protein
MRGGKRVAEAEPIARIRERSARTLASLPVELRLLEEPGPSWAGYAPSISPRLAALVEDVRRRVQAEPS